MKNKETLEEALYNEFMDNPTISSKDREVFIKGGLFGAKWQQERSYSEEDLISLLEFNYKKETNGLGTLRKDYSQKIIKEWFEQFKKK